MMEFDLKKNDLREYLKGEGVTPAQLSDKAKKAIDIFYKMKLIYERNPNNVDMLNNANKTGSTAMQILEKEVRAINSTTKERKTKASEKRDQRSKSLKVVKKTDDVKSNLDECRKVIREDRKQKLASGEIKKAKKKTRTTKMMELFTKILKLCPSDDPKVINEAEKEMKSFARKMFKLYGLTRIEAYAKAIEETMNKKQNQIDKEERKAAA